MKTIKILLADDHAIILDGLKALLEKEPDMDVAALAYTGEDVLEILKQQPIDVVVMDISMPPGMDGIKTAKYIWRRHSAVKVILLTMSGDRHFIANAINSGVNGYVLKEKSKESLIAAIRAVYSGNNYFPPDLFANAPAWGDLPEEEVKLTKRELEILEKIVEDPDLTSKDIGDLLFIERVTVDRHLQNIREKLDIRTRAGLLKYAIKIGLHKPKP
jgi:DNA-binding NarL/FixJ family response regulator